MDVLLIRSGVVENCISADSPDAAQAFYPAHVCIERTGSVGPGWHYDGLNFTAPAIVPPAIPTVISRLEFLRRMPVLKRMTVRTASKNDAVLADALGMLDMADLVDTRNADTQMMIGYCVQQGYFTSDEAAVILGSK